MNPFKSLKPVVVACALIAAGTAGVTAQKYGVTVNAEKNVDFAKFKTYTWTEGRPSPDKTTNGQIIAAVDRELAALGMTKAATAPGDVLVTYYSTGRTDVDVKAKPDARGLHPEQTVGTLVVALLDPATRRPVLRLRADKPIEPGAGGVEAAISSAATELFAKYPTRTKK
jgi:hypothetical protein